jgi:DNA-binding NtrC family response regulator
MVMQRLLIIDDEAGIRFSIRQLFEGEGVEVFDAECAEEGLRLAAEIRPDVILLDIRLGRFSGLELFDKLRRVCADTSIIFITGHGTAETALQAKTLGACDYLIKPLDVRQLQQVVGRALAAGRSAPAASHGRSLRSV